ncbi:MAG: DUF1622 domain-containing protein [Methanomassiliicoccaceae archaeon]|jgi:uncharacterized membrane protein|nr:DUF1622 domain-containing protein [Euryarchaeota archaeon]HOB38635.1 DUF1622 domain-containing protein [Methanomassiliicoccaceae archaeon]HPP45078.1 DUF1622 domain-containing protein [Methanomassiliicoccaceae archaeon]HQA21037.1 DUF1622 domain-containing protein [Methanomassiliicoccaceae archaeon]HQD88281.1 DUF1622 domain-containing protein [Methanomassiliicoccaceae archaeon]
MSVLDVVDPVEIVEIIAWIIAAFGLIIIILASFDTFIRLVNLFIIRHPDEQHERLDLVVLREKLTSRIIFGLDFLIASDVVLSVLVPNLEEILRLGGTVLIRVVLTFLISKETQELERRQQWEREHDHLGDREA